jgi:hypothetical protein
MSSSRDVQGSDSVDILVAFADNPFKTELMMRLLQGIARIEPSIVPIGECDGGRLISRREAGKLVAEEIPAKIIESLEAKYELAEQRYICLAGGSQKEKSFVSFTRPQGPQSMLSLVSLSVQLEDINAAKRKSSPYELFESLIEITHPSYGYLSTKEELEYKELIPQRDHSGKIVAMMRQGMRPEDGLFAIYHLNYFGPVYVGFFGREQFDAVRKMGAVVDDRPSGGVSVRVGDDPQDWRDESNILASMEIARILDHNAFMDRNDPNRRLDSPFRAATEAPPQSPHSTPISSLLPIQEATASSIKDWSDNFIKGMKKTFHEEMRLDKRSLERLDAIIDEGWDGKPPEELDMTIQSFGSFMGEAMRTVYGGEWKYDPEFEENVVVLANKIAIYPYSKIEKRFKDGREDSIGFLLRVIERETD